MTPHHQHKKLCAIPITVMNSHLQPLSLGGVHDSTVHDGLVHEELMK